MDSEWISPKELSSILKVSKPWPYQAIKRGLLTHYKIGKLVRFKKTDIEDFLEGLRIESKEKEHRRRNFEEDEKKPGLFEKIHQENVESN